jgi:predicted CoA-substrate-specific enzyme activase
MRYYLGCDIGSVSIKLAVVNDKGELVDKVYLKNYGLIDSIKKALIKLDNYNISGVGITGSGKEFINILIGGDIIESEIIAHSTATLKFYPDTKTIFDIGGEDSKLMIIKQGIIYNFMMNRDCGAGCGAMIESIASRVGIKIEDVGDIALKSKNDISLPSKCGIFCQSAVVSKLNKGLDKSDILMGVCKGLISNFLNMLAKGKVLEPPFVFQGATAKNKALVYCFEKELNHSVIVPEYCSYMGAIGMALLALEKNPLKTNFRGINIVNTNFDTRTKMADGCSNQCEITYIYENDKKIGHMGNRCEKCVRKEEKVIV